MKTFAAVLALAIGALIGPALLDWMRGAQAHRAPRVAAVATPTATASATPEPEFIRPGELAPPPGSLTPEPERADRVASSPEQAIRDYVELAGNWTASSVIANYRKLSARTIGDARVHAQQMVARVPIDKTYQARKPSLQTELAGAVRRGGTSDTPTYLVVIRQRLTMKGAPAPSETPAWQLATATLAHTQGGWALTRWKEPRS
jgi:hypothetical protein